MKQKDLPQRWQNKLQNYLIESGSKYQELFAYDFQHDSKITFEDGSYAFIHYAFYWIDEEWKEVCVFTEHCGYHVFYLPEILLETLDWEGNILKTNDYRTE